MEHKKFTKFEHDKIVVGSNGKVARTGIWGRRVVIPNFEVFQNPTIRIDDVKQRRFSLIDRAVQKARNQIMEQEDADIFAALDVKSSGNKEE